MYYILNNVGDLTITFIPIKFIVLKDIVTFIEVICNLSYPVNILYWKSVIFFKGGLLTKREVLFFQIYQEK